MFEVRDLRKKDKFFVDDAFVDKYARIIGIHAAGTYMCLCRHVGLDQSCYPSRQLIAAELKISVKQVGRSINILEDYKLIKKVRIGKRSNNRYYLLDKNRWLLAPKSDGTVSPITQSDGTVSPITRDYESYHQGLSVPSNSKDTHVRNTHVRNSARPKDIFNYWNSLKTVIHRNFYKFESHIKACLKYYKPDEIKAAMKNYALVLKSEDYFWEYKWSLDQFLARKNGLDKFLPENFSLKGYLKHKDKRQDSQTPTKNSSSKLSPRQNVRRLCILHLSHATVTKEHLNQLFKEIPQDYQEWVFDYIRECKIDIEGLSIADLKKEVKQNQHRIGEFIAGVAKHA